MTYKIPAVVRADVPGLKHKLKKRKNRLERRRARLEPECSPAYNRFKGYLS